MATWTLPANVTQTANPDGTMTLTNTVTGKTSVWQPDALDAHMTAWQAARVAMQPPLAGDVFLSRLTDAEYIAIKAAAATQEAAGNAQLSRWIETLRATNSINLASNEAQAAKAAFVRDDLLTPERADIVFSIS